MLCCEGGHLSPWPARRHMNEAGVGLFGHMLFGVSCMHVFCSFLFALVQRNRACFT